MDGGVVRRCLCRRDSAGAPVSPYRRLRAATPRHRRVVLYVALGLLVSFIVGRQEQSIDDLHQVIESEAREDRVEAAEACVSAWEGRADIRDQAEAGYRRNARTLLDLADNPDNPRAAAYRDQVELDVDEIRAELPDPECSLGHARRVLEKENR